MAIAFVPDFALGRDNLIVAVALSFFSFLTIAFPAIFHPLPRANDYVVLRLRGVGTHGPEGLLNPRGRGGQKVPPVVCKVFAF